MIMELTWPQTQLEQPPSQRALEQLEAVVCTVAQS
jgi:hypothetical protein